MMKFRINFEHQDGADDYFVASGETLDEVREVAEEGVKQRNGKNPWSEELS
jgi:hypothetical protein